MMYFQRAHKSIMNICGIYDSAGDLIFVQYKKQSDARACNPGAGLSQRTKCCRTPTMQTASIQVKVGAERQLSRNHH